MIFRKGSRKVLTNIAELPENGRRFPDTAKIAKSMSVEVL